MNVVTKTIALGDGRTISIETGKLAKQADGSVMVRMGDTMLLATVCSAKDAAPGTDFMPLSLLVASPEVFFVAKVVHRIMKFWFHALLTALCAHCFRMIIMQKRL